LSEERVVVIGASAGGVEALMQLAGDLPDDFPAPIGIVLHIPADSPGMLAEILGRKGPLRAKTAEDGEPFRAGTIYVAAPNLHLIISHGDGQRTLSVAKGPRENCHRPAIDPLFRSAALTAGPGAIGVVLSGTRDDGTAGLLAIKECGGLAVVQEPKDATYAGMPQSAIDNVEVDHVVRISELGALLSRLVREPIPPRREPRADRDLALETRIADLDAEALHSDDRPGKPSPFSCPDCGGVLWEIEQDDYTRYRCRVGHAYSPESMLGAQDDVLEEALWSALKTLEENARLSSRLAASERERGNQWLVERFEEKERDARQRVEVIRRYLLRGGPPDAALAVRVRS
jgi:two-component system, chemotaxis family, protein-glutamate methylesterase/glutaminase